MKIIKTVFTALISAGLVFIAIHFAWRDKHAFSSANGVWKTAHVTYKGLGLIGQSALGYMPQKFTMDGEYGRLEAIKRSDGWHFMDFDVAGHLLAKGIFPDTMVDDFGIPVPNPDLISYAESFDLEGKQMGLITEGNGTMTKIFPKGAEISFVYRDGRQESSSLTKKPE